MLAVSRWTTSCNWRRFTTTIKLPLPYKVTLRRFKGLPRKRKRPKVRKEKKAVRLRPLRLDP
jgi:hypothetical protein